MLKAIAAFLFGALAICGGVSAQGSGGVPTFDDIGAQGFTGQKCINVNHPDGYADSVCLREKYPGFPTILEGYLDNENDVKVTAILEDDQSGLSTVVFNSQHETDCTKFIVIGNGVECFQGLERPQSLTSFAEDDFVDFGEDPNAIRSLAEQTNLPRRLEPGYKINVVVLYDDVFQRQFGAQAPTRARAIMAIVDNMYSEKATLTTSIDVTVVGVQHASGQNWNAMSSSLLRSGVGPAAQRHSSNAHLFVGLTGTNRQTGILGWAPVGVICDSRKAARVSLNQFRKGRIKDGDAYTAETVGHEMGHNLGMSHDHIGNNPKNLKKHNGKTCNGYMDYFDKTQGWSGCSVSDFTKKLNRLQQVCIRKGNRTPGTPPVNPPVNPPGGNPTCTDCKGCRRWCKYCKHCAALAQKGYCTRSKWAKNNCKKSCNTCAASGPAPKVDPLAPTDPWHGAPPTLAEIGVYDPNIGDDSNRGVNPVHPPVNPGSNKECESGERSSEEKSDEEDKKYCQIGMYCAEEEQCTSDKRCCKPKKNLNAPCEDDEECKSGKCDDDVCENDD